MNKQLMVLAVGVGLFLAPAWVLAQEGNVHDHGAQGAANSAVVGNTICPVSGEKVGEMGKVVTVEHNGKVYNLCCAMCAKDFKKDPEKYSKIAEEQAAQNTGSEEGRGQMDGDGHSHDH